MATQKKEALLYASTSANLYNFLGIKDPKVHYSIYQQTIENNLKAHEDIYNIEPGMIQVIDPNKCMADIHKKPQIFVTFHTGSFNLFTAILLHAGHTVNVMADTQSLEVGDYQKAPEFYRKKYNNNCGVEMINVEEQGAIFKIIRKVKKHEIMLAYLDGNKGIGGQVVDNKNMMETDFLQGRVIVRKGLPYMAYLTKAPLILVLNYFSEGHRFIKIYDPIEVGACNREEFCEKAINQIFRYFEDHVKEYSGQWSNWPHVHGWSVIDYFKSQVPSPQLMPPSSYKRHEWNFNHERFCPLKIEQDYFLLDRLKYDLTPISTNLAPIFSQKTEDYKRQKMIVELLENDQNKAEELINSQILI